MRAWTLDEVKWERFDAARVDPDLLALVKAASLVEANAADYVAYLKNVFAGDAEFLAAVDQWGREEEQHGHALGRWAELADPGFDFAAALARFRAGYRIPVDAEASIRGSRAGELVARQVVETGTSSFYSAIRDATTEPLLAEIAGRIAADEFRHYRLFHTHCERYQAAQALPVHERLQVAATRFAEATDEELGWAWFAANVQPHDPDAVFDIGYARDYARRAFQLYRREHIDNGARMLLRAVALRPGGWLFRLVSNGLWGVTRLKVALA